MIFKKNREPAADELFENEPENPFLEAANTLAEMEENGELPEGFDLSEAVKDSAFAELVSEFEPKAAVRIYAAEKRAEQAEENVRTRISEQARSRKALPKSNRTDRAVAPAPDYMAMSKEAFSALEKQYRTAAHNGRRVHI